MSVSVIIKWGGQEYSINTLSEEDTVLDLKQSIKSLTGVLPERQKLLGLKVKGGNRCGMTNYAKPNCEMKSWEHISDTDLGCRLNIFCYMKIKLFNVSLRWPYVCHSSGKPADDDVKLGDLKLKPNTKIMMMGTREESLVSCFFYCIVQVKLIQWLHFSIDSNGYKWMSCYI